MLATVNKLINSNISAAEIYRQTGVYDTGIKKLRLGKQDINTMTYGNLKKLYDYQMSLDEAEIKEDTYAQYQDSYEKLNDIENYEEKYKALLNLNTKLGVKIRELINEPSEDETKLETINKYLDLLITHEDLK